MAFTSFAFTFTLLVATACCLVLTSAEEEVPVTSENRESKQLLFAPQFYPANTQYYYPESSPYGNPFGVPAEGSFINNYQGARLPSYPSAYSPLDDPSTPSWRHVYTGGHDKLKWWKKNFHREATINIAPAAAGNYKLYLGSECIITLPAGPAVAQIITDGLGPCKRATQAEQGTISITFSAADQAAFIAITADSQRNTRVKLTCTEITDNPAAAATAPAVFTQTGKINGITDTPRTEIGFMQIVVVSLAATNTVKCNWHSYHHYTGTYP